MVRRLGDAEGTANVVDAIDRYDRIRRRVAPLRQELLQHSLYSRIADRPSLHHFLEHHVFAVWDFMSLLKALQRRLSCVAVPWLPPQDRAAARLVNEIVLGEESDDDGEGGHCSHFDLYLRAMHRCGADASRVNRLLSALREGLRIDEALAAAEVSPAVSGFVLCTFDTIATDDLPTIAAAFTFGREDLLPDVFRRIVDELAAAAGSGLVDFLFYLDRHIEVDSDRHGPMAAALLASACGNDERRWERAESSAVESLQARRRLWDGVLATLPSQSGSACVRT